MHRLSCAVALLFATQNAVAAPFSPHDTLFDKRTVAWFGADLGVSGAGVGFHPHAAWDISFGTLFGAVVGHDDVGRLWGIGARVRQDLRPIEGELSVRTAPMLEVRRELDILIFGVHGAVLAGPLFDSAAPSATRLAGGTVRLAGGARLGGIAGPGLSVRLEAGVDVTQKVTPSIGLLVGFEHRIR